LLHYLLIHVSRLFTLLGVAGWSGYQKWRIRQVFAKYPEAVQKPLARAIYYQYGQKDPERAMKAYREALFACDEAGLHPLNNLVIGLVGQIATFLIKHNNLEAGMELLDGTRTQGLEWLSENNITPENAEQRAHIIGKVMGVSVMVTEAYEEERQEYWDRTEEYLSEVLELLLKEKRAWTDMDLHINVISEEEMGGLMDCEEIS
jgi:hypothetical protein